jgi:hypothetical protein
MIKHNLQKKQNRLPDKKFDVANRFQNLNTFDFIKAIPVKHIHNWADRTYPNDLHPRPAVPRLVLFVMHAQRRRQKDNALTTTASVIVASFQSQFRQRCSTEAEQAGKPTKQNFIKCPAPRRVNFFTQ